MYHKHQEGLLRHHSGGPQLQSFLVSRSNGEAPELAFLISSPGTPFENHCYSFLLPHSLT